MKTAILASLREISEEHYDDTNRPGFFDDALLQEIGLSLDEKTKIIIKSGFTCCNIVMLEKGVVIKHLHNDDGLYGKEKMIALLPNESRYMLQPYCWQGNSIRLGYFGIFPLLDCENVGDADLQDVVRGLERENLNFCDDKLENIGSYNGRNFALDLDSVDRKTGLSLKPDQSIPSQWDTISPLLPTASDAKYVENSRFEWDPIVRLKMAKPLMPQSATRLAEKAQEASFSQSR